MQRGKFWKFISEVKNETKKVSWPSKEQMVSSTGAVVLILIVSGLFLGFLDVAFTYGIGGLLDLLTGAN